MTQYYHIVTYGCQMNVHESEKIAGVLEGIGLLHTDLPERADVVFFNTCCIRLTAEQRAYGNIGALKGLKKERPRMVLGVAGCMTQREGEAERLREKFPFIDIVLGTHNLSDLAEAVKRCLAARKKTVKINLDGNTLEEDLPVKRSGTVNAWVNIMYGCNNFCTYCIVPYVQGRERSRSFADICSETEGLLKEGYRQITLLGQNVNSYGNDAHEENGNFAALLRALDKLPYRYLLNFMTSHPKDLTEEVMTAIAASTNISECIHLPVQSGSDKILAAMNRRYDSSRYLQLVEKIRTQIPGVRLTTDLIVGFPGETEEDFCDTLRLIERVRFSNAYTFVYSRRPGTAADRMEQQIPAEVKKRRIGELIKCQNAISAEIGAEYIGNTYAVLFESLDEKRPGRILGKTNCGRTVSAEGNASFIGEFCDVRVISSGPAALKGVIV